MSTSESPRPALTEDDVDALLTRFFEDEFPPELRSPRLSLPPASPRGAPLRNKGGSRAAVVILLAGLCCLLGVALLVQPEQTPQSGFAADSMLPASPDEFAAPSRFTAAPRVPGVEEETHLVPASTTGGDSQAPPKIEVMIPELQVELFPEPAPGTR